MHDIVHAWARDWHLTPYAVLDLFGRLGVGASVWLPEGMEGWSEAAVQSRVRLDASKAGILNYRNNIGAYQDDAGGFVRYGLCNDTRELNKKVKSADLIGCKPVMLFPHMIPAEGMLFGQFWSREVKEAGWVYKGTEHEVAQLKWQQIILSAGGDAAFTTGSI